MSTRVVGFLSLYPALACNGLVQVQSKILDKIIITGKIRNGFLKYFSAPKNLNVIIRRSHFKKVNN